MEHFHASLSNIHCESCAVAIHKVFSRHFKVTQVDHFPSVEEVQQLASQQVLLYVDDRSVDVFGNNNDHDDSVFGHVTKPMVRQLLRAGFHVLAWEVTKEGQPISSSKDAETKPESVDGFFDIWALYNRYFSYKSAKTHRKNCKICHDSPQKFEKDSENDCDSINTVETVVNKPDTEYRAVFTISGMTCASCVQAISEQISRFIQNEMDPKQPDESKYSVSLLQNMAVVIIPNKHVINKIIDGINDLGYEAKLIEVLPVQTSINRKVIGIIGGMTCAACVNAIQTAVNELPFILECAVNLVSKSGQFVLDDSGDEDENLKTLTEKIEDCGFDFEVMKSEKINYTLGRKKTRSININVKGMFCEHCPEIITQYLSSFGEAVIISDPITLENPFINFTYIPGEEINVRKFLFDLNHLKPSDHDSYKIDPLAPGVFECEIIEPVSMDEHLRKLSKQEVFNLSIRLVIATVFAIPTFVFGVVAMSLLPSSNKFKKWVDEPTWAGNVARNCWILLFLSTPVYFCAADIFHRKAIKELKNLWLNKNSFRKRLFRFGSMNLLMCLGTTISYFASIVLLVLASKQERDPHHGSDTTYFDSVVFLTFFLLIGKLLESITRSKTADAISSLSDLKAAEATLVELDDEGNYTNDQIIDVKLLETGDYLRVNPGESPPVDCVIISGESEFDESALTGESRPVKHILGHQIFSGTVNTGAMGVIGRIISLDGDSLIDQIVSTVRDGQLRKAPIERTADKLTSYFVPVITALAIITWVIWLSLGHSGALPEHYLDVDVGGWTVWSLEFSIAVFVIACPCGIGLAAPTALFVGSGLAAKYGILAKGGGAAFQDGANTSTICFDKTGTLTNGDVRVTDFYFGSKENEQSQVLRSFALQVTRDMEVTSKHPLAKAVKKFVDEFTGKSLSPNKIPSVETVPGKGLRGEIIFEANTELWSQYEPSEAILGNEKFLVENGVSINMHEVLVLTRWKNECKSVILVAIKCQKIYKDDQFHLVMMMAARDQIRSETIKVIEFLKRQKIDCWMITGDNSITAHAIGKEIGITNIVSEVLPDQKQLHVERIQKLSGGVVAMVGDGINDAPALATADVGIALSSGADLAVTSSDFILLNKAQPLVALVTLLDLSRVVFNRVKFNFCWSLVYNMIGVPVAAGVIYPYHNTRLSPVWASAAMALSSVSVVMSSLALKLYRPKVQVEEVFENKSEAVIEAQ
ncbi:heavy metal translocatin [Suhomyces tanzawaensis NRRL Y-17324]|uniref:Heavy metal translocatin n=1 Tax=Suhomyces tanzawaensis NRRL Y-17324 TaxID=984487 RepID=A0A1E4SLR8_9ASCO|nr:heavy metal translocatin [Suhomyces tanzawaensis NRRL Y-17324]ODV80428.1 heavy metal translocatin [Suhomyces tanzawaensis NRRL Y-17324]